jgi:two-component system, OmpR family, sensor histidine kinase KdpD
MQTMVHNSIEIHKTPIAAKWRQLSYALMSLGLVAFATAALSVFVKIFPIEHITIVYLIPVLISSVRWGLVPGLVAALSSILAADFFFYLPYYSFWIHDPLEIVELLLFAFVSVVTSHLAAKLRHEAELTRQREQKFHELYDFAKRLAASYTPNAIYSAIQDHLTKILHRQTTLFRAADGDGAWQNSIGDLNVSERVKVAAQAISTSLEPKKEALVDDRAGGLWLVRAISNKAPEFGMIIVHLGTESGPAAQKVKEQVEIILADAAATFERLDLARAIDQAKVRAETETFREALMGSISHELGTPLASILGAATTIGESPLVATDMRLRLLVTVIHDEAEHLSREIKSLLDMTRIVGQEVRAHQQLTDPTDIINAALDESKRKLTNHTVELSIPHDLPLIKVDTALVQQALVQIFDNAAKYSSANSTIKISAAANDQHITISVRDQGAGLTSEEQGRMYERSFRGDRHASHIAGSGLGLWIAHTFVTASGGDLNAQSEGRGRGTTVLMQFPAYHVSEKSLAIALNE